MIERYCTDGSKTGRCFCPEALHVEQFPSKIISFGWCSGLHGYMQVMLHLISMFRLFGFQLYYYQMKANKELLSAVPDF